MLNRVPTLQRDTAKTRTSPKSTLWKPQSRKLQHNPTPLHPNSPQTRALYPKPGNGIQVSVNDWGFATDCLEHRREIRSPPGDHHNTTANMPPPVYWWNAEHLTTQLAERSTSASGNAPPPCNHVHRAVVGGTFLMLREGPCVRALTDSLHPHANTP